MLPVLLVVAGPPLLAGIRGRPMLGLLWAAGFAALAVMTTVNEPANYDMPTLGLRLFGGAAALAGLALAAGATIRRLRGTRGTKTPTPM